ncbi:hypothetical protein EDC22_11189 [Tepidamorphus gemmatus]|uniref:General secretion pathway protein N n=1 Tax=Tepidamorphus gemmatus TaxID=747076 RepID=A0A4R3M1H0_9HYPH|nr:hypothetical protein [Tepidamorphus gemmatus]TCT06506.1 hypothetical protein EDC22_11189 [Tepidamorphus gemmatus]
MTRLGSIAVVCLLAAIGQVAGGFPAVAQASGPSDAPTGGQAPGAVLEGLTLDDLAATRERPLFTPARHPPLPPPPPPPPPPPTLVERPERQPPAARKPPQLRLVGVIITDDRMVAIMMGQKRQVHRLAVGDEVDGWKVVAVEPNSVKMQFRKESRVYRMFRSRVRIQEVRPSSAQAGVN